VCLWILRKIRCFWSVSAVSVVDDGRKRVQKGPANETNFIAKLFRLRAHVPMPRALPLSCAYGFCEKFDVFGRCRQSPWSMTAENACKKGLRTKRILSRSFFGYAHTSLCHARSPSRVPMDFAKNSMFLVGVGSLRGR